MAHRGAGGGSRRQPQKQPIRADDVLARVTKDRDLMFDAAEIASAGENQWSSQDARTLSRLNLRVVIGAAAGQIINDVYVRQPTFNALVRRRLIRRRVIQTTNCEAD